MHVFEDGVNSISTGAQPDKHFECVAVDVLHHAHLLIPFVDGSLFNTYGVYPKKDRCPQLLYVSQGRFTVRRDLDSFPVTVNETWALARAPDVRQSHIFERGFILQRYFNKFAFQWTTDPRQKSEGTNGLFLAQWLILIRVRHRIVLSPSALERSRSHQLDKRHFEKTDQEIETGWKKR